MKKINFVAKRKMLHYEMLESIIDLMKANECCKIVFGKGKDVKLPRVLRWLNKIDTYELVEVKVIRIKGHNLVYKAKCSPKETRCEKDWWPLDRLVAYCHITELYDAVYDYFHCFKYAA